MENALKYKLTQIEFLKKEILFAQKIRKDQEKVIDDKKEGEKLKEKVPLIKKHTKYYKIIIHSMKEIN